MENDITKEALERLSFRKLLDVRRWLSELEGDFYEAFGGAQDDAQPAQRVETRGRPRKGSQPSSTRAQQLAEAARGDDSSEAAE